MGDETTRFNRRLWLGLKKSRPYFLMVLFQLNSAGLYVISTVTLKQGMSHYILPVYRHAVATLALVPVALVMERQIRPKMTLSIFLRIMLLGFIEPVLDQNICFVGMKYTSATFAAAIANLTPAFTFIIAFILRLERVDFKKIHSLAKVIGTLVSIGGAMIMAFYKGPTLDFIKLPGIMGRHGTTATTSHSSTKDWIIGTLLLLGSSCAYSGFAILQTITLKMYPAPISLTAFIAITGSVEGAVVALPMEHHMNAWKLGWDSRLLAVTYSGVVSSGIGYYVQGVVCDERGPVFVTSFFPLGMILTAVIGVIVLAEQLFLGSVIGGVLIVTGLYTFVWGKNKDPIPPTTSMAAIDKNHEQLHIPDTEAAAASKNGR